MSKALAQSKLISDSLLYGVTLCYIGCTVFILPSSLKSFASVIFAGLAFILLCCQRPCRIVRTKLSLMLLAAIAVVAIASLITFALSPYSKADILVTSAFLLVSILLFYDNLRLPERSLVVERIFYACVTTVIVVEVVTNLGVTRAMYVSGAYDKNYFAIILFLYFCWCWSTHRKLGVAISVASSFFLGSRNYLIMLALFAILTIANEVHSRMSVRKRAVPNKWQKTLSPGMVFAAFTIVFVGVALFSLWWSASMVGANTLSYAEGLNDSSNAIRFNSNVFALNHISDNPQLFVYGYGDDIIDALGIIQASSLDGTETALDGAFFNGYRIVQPHNIIFNMLLKEGALYTVGYFGCLSFVFSKYFKLSNAACWIPFLFGCMFMHSLMSTYYLVFLLLVLARMKTSGAIETESVLVDTSRHANADVEADRKRLSQSQRHSALGVIR